MILVLDFQVVCMAVLRVFVRVEVNAVIVGQNGVQRGQQGGNQGAGSGHQRTVGGHLAVAVQQVGIVHILPVDIQGKGGLRRSLAVIGRDRIGRGVHDNRGKDICDGLGGGGSRFGRKHDFRAESQLRYAGKRRRKAHFNQGTVQLLAFHAFRVGCSGPDGFAVNQGRCRIQRQGKVRIEQMGVTGAQQAGLPDASQRGNIGERLVVSVNGGRGSERDQQ